MKKPKNLLIFILAGIITTSILTLTGCDKKDENPVDTEFDQVKDIAEETNEWSYRLEIDEIPIADKKDIEINKKDFIITLAEEQSNTSSDIKEENQEGKHSGEYQNHFKIIGIEPSNAVRTDGTIVTGFRYEFEEVPENTNFKIELSNELKEKLNLNNSVINIKVR